jgi:hypothetical protein
MIQNYKQNQKQKQTKNERKKKEITNYNFQTTSAHENPVKSGGISRVTWHPRVSLFLAFYFFSLVPPLVTSFLSPTLEASMISQDWSQTLCFFPLAFIRLFSR